MKPAFGGQSIEQASSRLRVFCGYRYRACTKVFPIRWQMRYYSCNCVRSIHERMRELNHDVDLSVQVSGRVVNRFYLGRGRQVVK
jgi:hypothetical protein